MANNSKKLCTKQKRSPWLCKIPFMLTSLQLIVAYGAVDRMSRLHKNSA